jgi:ABC-type nitrate/sulfonate/bicarbonate transport system substrate-binding protein
MKALGLVVAAMLLAGLARCLPAVAAESLTVGKAAANTSTMLPTNVGEKLGIYAKHGLAVTISDFSAGSKLVQAMTARSIDIGIGAGPLMALTLKGAPVRAICNSAPPVPFIGIALPWDSPIRSVDQLKGKTIGFSSSGSLTDWLARELVRTQGWGSAGVKAVSVGNDAAGVMTAFRSHDIDADIIATSDIFAWEEKQQGRLLIPVSSYVGNIGGGVLFATDEIMARKPDAVRSFLAAWLETIDDMRKNKAETVAIESAVSGYSSAVMAKEYDLTIGMFSTDCKFDAQSLANLERSFADLKLTDTAPDMSKLYTEAYVPKR